MMQGRFCACAVLWSRNKPMECYDAPRCGDEKDYGMAYAVGDTGDDSLVLQRALSELQATTSNFAASCIRDAGVRAQYARDIHAVSHEFVAEVRAGRLTAKAAAEQVNVLRNRIMDLSRLRSNPTGCAYAMRLKGQGRTLAELTEKYAGRLFRKPFAALSEAQQAAVYFEIVSAGGRADPAVMGLSKTLGKIGRRLFTPVRQRVERWLRLLPIPRTALRCGPCWLNCSSRASCRITTTETLRAAQVGAVELADILRDEVAPAFMGNLSGLNPVPEMECWSESEVRERGRAAMVHSRGLWQRLLRRLRADPLRHPALQERCRILLGLLRII
jgi:hypothetical protein